MRKKGLCDLLTTPVCSPRSCFLVCGQQSPYLRTDRHPWYKGNDYYPYP